MSFCEVYSYLSGMLKVLDNLSCDLGEPSAHDSYEELNKKRLDCAERLFFVKESLEYFLPGVAEAWNEESVSGRTA